jgi:hypothetical protein
MNKGMSASRPDFSLQLDDHRRGRQHRFMESADINTAFRELFTALRSGVRRGMSNNGQIHAIEMDVCLPGVLMGTEWITLPTYGIQDPAKLEDPLRRQVLYRRLLAEPRSEALMAYVCERQPPDGATLYLEIASVDACYAAEYPVMPGSGWHLRELLRVPHQRIDIATA